MPGPMFQWVSDVWLAVHAQCPLGRPGAGAGIGGRTAFWLSAVLERDQVVTGRTQGKTLTSLELLLGSN